MIKQFNKNEARLRRHTRLRKKITGTAETPRLNVFRSNKAVYVQVIDDAKGITLVSASSKELKLENNNIETCTKVGELVAKKAIKAGISEVKFDRGGYTYHGKVKALADAARKEGLKF
ncbi:MAG: 50S ribosomal protein L18 [Spiroplasma sp.]|nr:50S ribosomal protein L18 [Mycoplasmatales bacterium]